MEKSIFSNDIRLTEEKLSKMTNEDILKYIISLSGYNEIINVVYKDLNNLKRNPNWDLNPGPTD